MAILDSHDTFRTETAIRTGNPITALASAFHGAVERQRERQAIVRLSRLPDHVVRDMGFDPDKVAAALAGTWDEIERR